MHPLRPLLRGGWMEDDSSKPARRGRLLRALGPDANAAPREHHNHRHPYGNAISRHSVWERHLQALVASGTPFGLQSHANCPTRIQLPNGDPLPKCGPPRRSGDARGAANAPRPWSPLPWRAISGGAAVSGLPPPPAPRRPFHAFFAPAAARPLLRPPAVRGHCSAATPCRLTVGQAPPPPLGCARRDPSRAVCHGLPGHRHYRGRGRRADDAARRSTSTAPFRWRR